MPDALRSSSQQPSRQIVVDIRPTDGGRAVVTVSGEGTNALLAQQTLKVIDGATYIVPKGKNDPLVKVLMTINGQQWVDDHNTITAMLRNSLLSLDPSFKIPNYAIGINSISYYSGSDDDILTDVERSYKEKLDEVQSRLTDVLSELESLSKQGQDSPDLNKIFSNHSVARARDLAAGFRSAAAEKPNVAPKMWKDRPDEVRKRGKKFLSPAQFIRNTYAPWLESEVLEDDDIALLDSELAESYRFWLYKHPNDKVVGLRPSPSELQRRVLSIGKDTAWDEVVRIAQAVVKQDQRKRSPKKPGVLRLF